MDQAITRLDQKRFLRGRQSLILEGDTLKVEVRQWLSLNEYRFDLRGFRPDPVRVKRVPLARITVSVFLTVAGAILLLAGATGTVDTDDIPPTMSVGLLLLIFAGLVWFYIAKELTNVVLFQGPGGQFVIWPDHHDKQELKGFLTLVNTRIRNAQRPEQAILRQLRVAEIISDWQYDQAMELFTQGQPRADA